MKVLHMISGGDSGGAKTHVFALLSALKKYCDVKIICLTPGVFYQEILNMDIDTVLIEQKNRADLSIRKKIIDIIEKEHFDILHIHGARANFVATLLKNKIKIPVVTTVHSDPKLDFTEGIYKRFVFTGLNMMALKMVKYYIGVSKNFKSMLIERGFKPNKIFTVYNGIDYDKERNYISKEEFAKRHNIEYNKDYIYVGIIGRFDYVKGHEIFIRGAKEALTKNPNLRFLLAGEGPLQNDLSDLAKELKIDSKIQFVGFIKDIYSFINFIDINTLTSLSESFPYVLLEGAGMKKPTISSDVGGISDLIENNVTGFLFENKNYKEFAERLIELADNEKLRKELGENLYNKATTKFSSDNLARTHIDIYNAILSDYKDSKEYDIVMSGYYGFNNSGDDAMLSAIIENLSRYKKYVRILTLSKNPKQTRERFFVDSANRFSFHAVKSAIKKSKLFLNGGGTLIHDSTSTHSLYYYLSLINMAIKNGLKTVIYANGFGPLKPKNEEYTRKITEKADLITLRDPMSYKELRRIGIKNKNVFVTADPAVTICPVNELKTKEILLNYNITEDTKYMVVSVRSWQKNDLKFQDKIANICDYAYEKYNIKSLFITMRPDEDYVISENIRNKMNSESFIIKEEQSAEILMGIIKKAQFVIGMRLHSLIYASTVCTPVIGIMYDPKIKGFMNYINQDVITDASDIDVSYVKEKMDYLVKNKEDNKKEMEKHLVGFKEKALQNAKLTIELLNKEL